MPPAPGETVPQALPLHPAPPRLQVTAAEGLPEAVTTALTCCVAPAGTVALAGETVTLTSLSISTLAEADFDGSAALVAVIATVVGEGRTCGAV